MAYWQEHSLGIAPQVGATGGFGSPVSTASTADFRWIQGETPKLTLVTEQAELKLMTGQIGAAPERLPGRRHGSISFSMPLEGLKTGYDPTAEDPGSSGVIPPWFAILANVLGSQMVWGTVDTATKFWNGLHTSVSQYTAGVAATSGVIAGCTTSLVKVFSATESNKIDVGQLVVAATTPTDTAPQFGWVKTKSGQDITLFEVTPATTVAANADDLYGSANAWLSSVFSNQLPLTMLYVGEATEACQVLEDCVCSAFKITSNSGDTPTIEFTFDFFNHSFDKTAGGLHVPTSFQRVPQLVGTNNSRATIGGAITCGIGSFTIEYKATVTPRPCHSATQGISAVSYTEPRVTASLTIPWGSTDPVYDSAGVAGNVGQHYWQSRYERGVTESIGIYVGSNVGRLFSFLIPAGRHAAAPQWQDNLDGASGYQLTIEAGSYTGDTTDTAETSATSPLDSIARAALA